MDENIYRKVFDEVIKVPEKDLFTIFFSCKEDMKKIEKDLIPKTRCTSMIKLVQYLLTAYICRNEEGEANEQICIRTNA